MKKYLRDKRSPKPLNKNISRVMSSNRSKNTKPELMLRKALCDVGLKGYRLNWKKAPGKPDVAFPGKKIAIFVNGCYWHRCPTCDLSFPKTNKEFWKAKFKANVLRDKKKEKELLDLGWFVLVFWECEVKENIKNCTDKIDGRIKSLSK